MTVFRWELRDVVRSRWLLAYAGLFLLATDALFRFGGSGERVVLSLMNVVLMLIPLVSVVFGTMYLYHAREFIELLLTQPVGRRPLFVGLYAGVAGPLALAFLVGVGVPFVLHGAGGGIGAPLVVLLAGGVLLTLVFTALAFLVAVGVQDRATGLGLAILIWIVATVIYDGLLLLGIALLGNWPIETPALVATLLNPVDLARILLLLTFDLAALMGYTGALYQRILGSGLGIAAAVAALVFWTGVPLWRALRRFVRKDF